MLVLLQYSGDGIWMSIATSRSSEDPTLTPCPNQNSSLRLSVRNQVSNGSSFLEEPGWAKNCSNCNFQDFRSQTEENQVSGCRKRRSAKGVRSLFFVFGTLSVTFWSLFLMLLSLYSSLFCQTPFAGLLLGQGEGFLTKAGKSLDVGVGGRIGVQINLFCKSKPPCCQPPCSSGAVHKLNIG